MVSVQRNKGILILVMLLAIPLFAAAAHAVAYSIAANSIKADILPNESASYTVTISNFAQSDGEFQAYTIDPSWIIKTEPLVLSVPAGSQRSFTVFLRPASSANTQTQGVIVNFRELNTNTVLRKEFYIGLRPFGTGPRDMYAPNLGLDVLMPYDVDPRSPVPMRLILTNRNPRNLTNLTVTISSPHFSNDLRVSLGPLSEKTINVEGLVMDSHTPPGEGNAHIQVLFEEKTINQLTKNYQIKEYTEIKQRVKEQSFFFKTEKTIEITNEGNVKNIAIVSVPTSFIKSLFISSSLPYENEVRDGARVVFWSVPLDPYGAREFTYTENYRILVLLFLLAVISAVAYLLLRSPVVAVKEAVAIARHEGVSDIKVRVFVKNRSAKAIQGLQVTDRVPSLGEVIKSESPGSISPSKIAVSEKQGTLLRWDLEVLEPFEERILTYQVKSKLKIIGHMKLPNARIRYMTDNKERAVYSNNIELVEKFKDH